MYFLINIWDVVGGIIYREALFAENPFCFSCGRTQRNWWTVEKICKNCEFFVQVSTGEAKYAFGSCMNPETSYVGENGKAKGVFRWADNTCIDFKPKIAKE